MPLLGAHMSIAGGYYRAVEAAANCEMQVVQIFTKNNNQWRAKAITDDEIGQFQGALAQQKISHPISHSSYLINLASPDDELWKKSIEAMGIELQRADQLGVPYVVMHPGSYTTTSEEEGVQRIADAIEQIHQQGPNLKSQILLENTAGQGSNLGWRFEHLAKILELLTTSQRVGVCFDTCHAFAAGYPLDTEKEFKATFKEFNDLVDIKRIKAFHLNDSKRERGSRVDRHEHIGQGHIGLNGFRHLLNDSRFKKIPMYLETPKGLNEGVEWDVTNIRTLRGLVE